MHAWHDPGLSLDGLWLSSKRLKTQAGAALLAVNSTARSMFAFACKGQVRAGLHSALAVV